MFEQIYAAVRQWGIDRNLHMGATIESQIVKFWEEYGETCAAFARGNKEGIIDGIGDCAVVLTILNTILEFNPEVGDMEDVSAIFENEIPEVGDARIALITIPEYFIGVEEYSIFEAFVALKEFAQIQGLDFVECFASAYNEIKDRKGKMVDGVFIKNV